MFLSTPYLTIFSHHIFNIGAWGSVVVKATSQTVPGSIPGGVTGDFFPWFLPTKPCALRSTQPLTMSTTDFSWGKGDRCLWLRICHPCSAERRDDTGP